MLKKTCCTVVALAAAIVITAAASARQEQSNVDLPRFPSISPDGSSVVFSWRGDLFKVAAEGGLATRLTSHAANEHRSCWSADGRRIAFTSDRDGYANIYLMNADGTDLRRVTNIDRDLNLIGFGTDGDGNEVITFDATLNGDVYRETRPYMVSVDGGPLRTVHDAFGSFPAVSPDGSKVLFTRGGYFYGWSRRHGRGPETMDVYLYDREDDDFRQLTDWAGHDGDARWLDDSTYIYKSDREMDTVNLYRASVSGNGAPQRVTNFEGTDIYDFDVAADDRTAVVHVWDALYIVDFANPDAPTRRIDITAVEDEKDNLELHSISRDVSEAALSPDGKVMAMVAYGEIYVRNVEEGGPTRRVTESHARDRDIAWSPDGLKLYFSSDRDGAESIYAASVTLTREEVKDEFNRILFPEKLKEKEQREKEEDDEADDEADDNADEPEDQENAAAPPDPVSGTWQGTADMPEGAQPFTLTLTRSPDNSVTGNLDAGVINAPVSGTFNPQTGRLSLSFETPDAVAVSIEATITNGTMEGTAIAEGVEIPIAATRVAGAGDDSQPAAQEEDEKKDLPKELDPSRWHDAMKFAIEPVVVTDHNDRMPQLSPDGKSITFKRSRGDVIMRSLETGEERIVAEGWDFGIEWRFSPDGRYLAFAQNDMDFNSDIFIVPADGSAAAVNVTKHPDNDSSPRWSADGKILVFVSERTNEENDIWRVFLDKDLEAMPRPDLEQYYEDAVAAANKRKPLEIEVPEEPENAEEEAADEGAAREEQEEEEVDEVVEEPEPEPEPLDLDDAYLRVQRITSMQGNEGDVEITPGGDRIIFSGSEGGPALYSIKWDLSDQKRLTGPADVQHVSLTGDKVVYVSGGQAGAVSPAGGSPETVAIDDEMTIDLRQQQVQKFREATRVIGEQFYHPTMKGLDWDALTERYGQLANQTRTANEFTWVTERLFGELTGSHLGVRGGGYRSPIQQSHGRLGARYERADDGFSVTETIPESPAALGDMRLEVGDVITAIELEPFEATDTVESRLEGRVGEETIISVRRVVDGEPVDLNLLMTPISYGQESGLQYEAWRKENARLVEEWSDGRLGYIHIQGMNQPSLDVFERDLFAAAYGRDGLVVDVRNNGGGWTADRLLSSIMVTPHAYTIPRGAPHEEGHYPQDRLFIQRYTLPMNMLCNEKSFSNAEITSHAFKNLNRGTLVGQQTWGGVISTGGFSLIDGTGVRLPFRGWYTIHDVDMENNPAVPDLIVPQTPLAEAAGEDEQLKAAVNDLLGRLDG